MRHLLLDTLPDADPATDPAAVATQAGRATCYRCHKPTPMCICGQLQIVENRTKIIILQHPRERFHPLGTARIARLGLRDVELKVAFRAPGEGKRVHLPLSLPQGTGLLYPGPGALPLADAAVAGAQRPPRQLVVLDGTWSQANRLYQDNPWLRALPHYRLEPNAPSRYRIRREPKPHCVSTIEAIAMALHALEPETPGIDRLLDVFDAMIDAQVTRRPAGASVPRQRKRPRERRSRRVPHALVDTPQRVVLVYGETAQLERRSDPRVRELLQWTAVRLDDASARFDAIVRPSGAVSDADHLARLALTFDVVSSASPLAQVVADFHSFLREGDVLAAWNPSTLSLLPQLGHDPDAALALKSAYCNLRGGRCGTLEDVLQRERIDAPAVVVRGRAGARLGNARAVARRLSLEP